MTPDERLGSARELLAQESTRLAGMLDEHARILRGAETELDLGEHAQEIRLALLSFKAAERYYESVREE